MVLASDVKAGMALQLDNKLYKVLEAVRHSGSGQMHGFIELKMHDVRFGHFSDRRFKHSDKLDDVELVKRQMDFLYADDINCYFMDPVTFEQFSLAKSTVGDVLKFMKEGMKITVQFLGEEAVSIEFAKIVELTVVSTGPGLKGEHDNTLKAAIVENDIEIMVPQFISTGDVVRVDTEKTKYVDRVRVK